MKITKLTEPIIYLSVIVLSLIIFVLASISPAKFLDVSAVYKGF